MPGPADNNSYTYKSLVQLNSDPICSSAGCNYKKQSSPYPIDYPVPSFGKDPDMRGIEKSIAWAEKKLNKKWVPVLKSDLPKPAGPVLYHDDTSALDSDVVSTLENSAIAEQTYGHTWTPTQDSNGNWNVPGPVDNASYTYKAAQTSRPSGDMEV